MADLSALSQKLIANGWKRVKDVEPVLLGMGGTIEYVSFLMDKEEFISDHELGRRALRLQVSSSQRDAEWLVTHQEMLVECPEDVRYIFFPGTEWEHPNDAHLWIYLYRTGKEEKWDIYAFWMDFGFSDEHVRLVRLPQVTSP